MPKIPESTKLQNYQDAISALPLDRQIQKTTAIKSPKTVRRFLSAEAPQNLVLRFAHRLNEVIDDLSPTERAQVHINREEIDQARNLYNEAVRNGDPEGHLGLAEIASRIMDEEHDKIALGHLEKAAEGGVDNEKLHLLRATIFYINDKDDEAEQSFKKAADRSNDPDQILNSQKGKETMFKGDIKKGVDLLMPEARKGHIPSILTLLATFKQMRDAATKENKKHCTENIETLLKIGIECGVTKWYKELGLSQEEHGRTEEAIESFKRSIAAGHTIAYPFLINRLLEENRIEEAEKLRDEALEKGYPKGHLIAAMIAGYKQSDKETIEHLTKAVNAGVELPPMILILALIENGEHEKALKECLKIEEKTTFIHICMSEIYKKMRNRRKSKRHMELAVQKAGLKSALKKAQKLRKRGLVNNAVNTLADACRKAFTEFDVPPEIVEKIIRNIIQAKLGIN